MLPDLIEIVPPSAPVQARISVPGSKSITNRALVLAALGESETVLAGALWSEDTQVMVDCLRELGYMVNVEDDPAEAGNRTITVYGRGGTVPGGGTPEQPLELFVGNAGTAARFLAAMLCLGRGVYRLHGVPRMHERPQSALFEALRQLGYRIDSPNNKLPALIHGGGPRAGQCRVSILDSSQFASALLLSGRPGRWTITVEGENAEESPYVAMTMRLIEAFPARGGRFTIECDASSAGYFWAASFLLPMLPRRPAEGEPTGARVFGSGISVLSWPESDWQIDAALPRVLVPPPATISRRTDLGDSILTAMVLAPFLGRPIRFTELGRLRLQECERVAAMRRELTQCGAKVVEADDTLTISPSALHGAEIATYNDHRIAMCFAILGLKIPGVKLQNPACVKKTFPNFFQKLAAAPPQGLGAVIRESRTGQGLEAADLFAG